MTFQLELPEPWASRGWKAKIRDRERLEPPHVSILHRSRTWRFGLRCGQFLDSEPSPGDVPSEVTDAVRLVLPVLRHAWDTMYPRNPVSSARRYQRETARQGRTHDE